MLGHREKTDVAFPTLLEAKRFSLDSSTSWQEPRESASYQYYKSRHFWSWVGQILLFSASVVILFSSHKTRQVELSKCNEKLSMWSPVFAAIGDNYQILKMNGSVLGDSSHLYRGPPSQALDERWLRLVDVGIFGISHETLLRIGASEDSVKLPPESGGGYMAMLEVHHQIHCVHMLWQNTHPSFYNISKQELEDPNSVHRKHIDHCADNLRQKLMCSADVGVITYNWVKHFSHPVPDFNTLHKCRDFDAVSSWALANQVPGPIGGTILKPADAVELNALP